MPLSAQEYPGRIAYRDPQTQRALEKMLKRQLGEDEAKTFLMRFARETSQNDKQGGTSLDDDSALYRAMFQRLVKLQPLPETAPKLLAIRRATVIAEALLQAGADPARLATDGIREVSASQRRIAIDLSLDVARQTSG